MDTELRTRPSESDDSDDDVLVRKKKSVRKVVLDSDSDEDNPSQNSNNGRTYSQQNKSIIDTDSDDSNDESEVINNKLSVDSVSTEMEEKDESRKAEHVDEDSEEELETPKAQSKKNKKKRCTIVDSDDSDDGGDKESNVNEEEQIDDRSSCDEKIGNEANSDTKKSKILKNVQLLDELFDAEDSSDDEKNDKGNSQHGDDGYHGDQGESEEDEPVMSAALKKKLAMIGAKGAAKGAAKKTPSSDRKASSSKVKRMKQEEMTELHSESQRMMREREVRMPYHNPKKMGLSVFLARTQQKQDALKTISAPGSWKNKPDLALLTKLENEEKEQLRKSDLRERLDLKMKDNKKESETSIMDKDQVCEESHSGTDVELVKKQLDLDSLPDLITESDHILNNTVSKSENNTSEIMSVTGSCINKVLHLNQGQKSLVIENKLCDGDIDSNITSEICNIQTRYNIENEDPISVGNKPEKINNKLPEQDSGYLTTPLNSSEEESNGTTLTHEENTAAVSAISQCVDNKNCDLVGEELENCSNEAVKEAKPDKSCDKNENEQSLEEKSMDEPEETESKTCTNESTDISMQHNEGTVTPKSNSDSCTKRKRTPKLASIAEQLPAPSLGGGSDSFIDLSDNEKEDSTPKPPSGVQKLLERLIQHSHSSKRSSRKSKDVEISTIVKDKGEDNEDKEELKVEKFVYHIEIEEQTDPLLNRPGAKLLKLKESLQERMAADREKTRKMRSKMFEMENEEGYEEEEEAELTDESDSDGEEEASEVDFNEEEEEMDMDEDTENENVEKDDNPFVDDEAGEDDDDDELEDEIEEEGLHLEFDTQGDEDSNSEKKSKGFLDKALTKTKSIELFDEEANTESPNMSQKSKADSIDISDRPFEQLSQGNKAVSQENEEPQKLTQGITTIEKDDGLTTTSSQSLFKESSFNNSMDMSFELMGSMIPAGQRTSKNVKLDDSPSSKSSGSLKKSSSLCMPIESSQDLFNLSTNSPASYSKQPSRNHHTSFTELNESESNLLDEDGLIKLEDSSKKARRQILATEKDTSDVEEEMLDLCSGKFTEVKSCPKKLFDDEEPEQGSTQELMGLCSGRFSGNPSSQEETALSQQSNNTSSPIHNGTQPFDVTNNATDIGDTQELLGLCSGMFSENEKQNDVPYSPDKAIIKRKKNRPVIEDEGEDDFEIGSNNAANSEDEQAEELGSDEEIESNKENDAKFSGLFSKKKKLRQEFVDEEAQLSGSEAESDEDYDLGDEEDILEEEDGDNDVLLSEEELRNQVGRVHLKSVIDADKKQIRLMQEMYLQDGDLHNEGGGRERKFRWRHVDDDTQDDLFNNASDEEEGADEETEQEKWRLERHEREKFLQEHQEKVIEEDDSQSIKFGKVCFKPKKTKSDVSNQLKPTENLLDGPVKKPAPPTPPGLFKKPTLKLNKAGSFLSRSNQALQKIKEMNKGALAANINGPRSSSRGFLFNTVTGPGEEKEEQEENKPQVKRANSTPSTQSVAKRPRLEKTNSIPKSSIFNLIN